MTLQDLKEEGNRHSYVEGGNITKKDIDEMIELFQNQGIKNDQ